MLLFDVFGKDEDSAGGFGVLRKKEVLSLKFIDLTRMLFFRFDVEGLGVTQPSQIRYIHYFHELLANRKVSPTVQLIEYVKLYGVPGFSGCQFGASIKTVKHSPSRSEEA